MSVNYQLAALFPRYEPPEMEANWNALKRRLPIGASVNGRVVHRESFGVFVDIGVGFPALILVVRLKNADMTPYTSMDMYPAVNAEVDGRIYVFDDDKHQVGVTQQPRESWMIGDW